MDEATRKIELLKKRIFLINMKDYLSVSDYKEIRECENEISFLRPKVTGKFAVQLVYKSKNYSQVPFYIGTEESACCSYDPVWYETEKEAIHYLSLAKLNADEYNVKIIVKGEEK